MRGRKNPLNKSARNTGGQSAWRSKHDLTYGIRINRLDGESSELYLQARDKKVQVAILDRYDDIKTVAVLSSQELLNALNAKNETIIDQVDCLVKIGIQKSLRDLFGQTILNNNNFWTNNSVEKTKVVMEITTKPTNEPTMLFSTYQQQKFLISFDVKDIPEIKKVLQHSLV